jgi:peptide deformylase
MIHDLVDKNHSILKTELDKFDFQNPPTDPIQLAHDLAETMLAKGGIGISANQIGLPYRAFAMMAEKIIVCFNPILLSEFDEQIVLEEGCLSYPNLFVKIKRPQEIRVRYTEPNGNIITEKFSGMTARVFQHELDHLNGVVYTKRANMIHLEQAKKNAKKGIRIPKISNETRILMNQMAGL